MFPPLSNLTHVGQHFCAASVSYGHVVKVSDLEAVFSPADIVGLARGEIQQAGINFSNLCIFVAPKELTLHAHVSCTQPQFLI
jgi:hypothetical protein